jgi:hypothetical protein
MIGMRRATAIAVVAALLGGLTACGGVSPDIPEGLTVVVYQPRPDVALGRFALQVVNAGEADVDIIAASLTSPDFVDDVEWSGEGSTVLAGRELDLRVPVPEIDCSGETDPRVRLRADAGHGVTESSEVPVSDPYGLLPRLHAEQCVGQAIAEIAAVTPREVIVPDGREPAILVLDVVPTGAAGSVELVGVRGTTLLQPADEGVSTPELTLGIEVSADGPTEVRVPFLPNRCDAHALAEDKVGTIIPFLVDAGTPEPVRWMLILSDELKGALYGYYAAYCDLDAG